MKGPGKGNTNNPYGRPKGIPNRTTEQAKQLLEQILYGQIENIDKALASIRNKSDKDYIDACVKMFKYVLPEKRDVTSGGESIQDIHITVDSSKTSEELKKLIDGGTSD